ncbi:MAG: aspartate aminotransferase family protein [Myxococcota bacterium]|jgi:glutamate/tyrosine decarboxylase-like PLP-dependent enzyme|nr:aspartate aminotransferase family protein [Myxococcota bacterium]
MVESTGKIPQQGSAWSEIRDALENAGRGDVDWRDARTAVYVFNPGDDVMQVAKEAYAMYQSENGLGMAAFPSIREMEADVVSCGLRLLNAPDEAVGNMTSGGTESIILAVKACRDSARARGRDVLGAKIVVPRSAHPAFDKAAAYLGLEVVRVPVATDFTADVAAMDRAIDDRTIMLVGSAPCFPFGVVDPIAELGKLADAHELWLHVDACVGGYFAPFARMNGIELPDFDFSVPQVNSMSADLHKYGYAAKGASTVFHRNEEQRNFQSFVFDDWPAGGMSTPTVAGTRPGGAFASAWAVMHYLGVEGYCEKAKRVTDTREKLMNAIDEIPGLYTFGQPKLGLFAYGAEDANVFAIWGALNAKGWFTGVITEPQGIQLMLSPAHADVADDYIRDLQEALEQLGGAAAPSDGTPSYN